MRESLELLVLLGVAVMANICCGMYVNIGVKGIKFDKKVFVSGIVKALCVSASFLGVSYIIYKVPDLSAAIGIEPKAMIISGIAVYASKAIVSLCNILGVSKTEANKASSKVEQTVKEELEEYVDM